MRETSAYSPAALPTGRAPTLSRAPSYKSQQLTVQSSPIIHKIVSLPHGITCCSGSENVFMKNIFTVNLLYFSIILYSVYSVIFL